MPSVTANIIRTNAQPGSSKVNMFDDEGIDEDYGMDLDDFEDLDEPSPAPIQRSNIPLKGRKRFMADLEEMKKCCVIGFGFHGFDLRSTCISFQYFSEQRLMYYDWYQSTFIMKLTSSLLRSESRR